MLGPPITSIVVPTASYLSNINLSIIEENQYDLNDHHKATTILDHQKENLFDLIPQTQQQIKKQTLDNDKPNKCFPDN